MKQQREFRLPNRLMRHNVPYKYKYWSNGGDENGKDLSGSKG